MRFGAALVAAGTVAIFATSLSIAQTAPRPTAAAASADPAVARGRYLVVYGGCNDCHTPGWRDADGDVPDARWLTGSSIGFRGAWGTSYPTNVRLDFFLEQESDWITAARTRAGHPPMVWEDLRGLTDADLHAIYAFVRHLGPAGVPAPHALPPWRTPTTPFVDLRPQPAPIATVPG
jgi:mono/diheme cytochrome c family protein